MFDSAVKDEAPKKGLLSRLFGMFDIFKESEHPRDKTGKFTDKNSGNKIAEKTYIHYKPIKDIIKSIKKYMGKPDGTYNMATGELKNYTTQTTNAKKISREMKRILFLPLLK